MIYSLIPAKMNSTRLPGKGTFKFMLGGKPMIAHTIEAVKVAGILPCVFTDESDITNTYGADIIPRSHDNTVPGATMKSVAEEYIKFMGLRQDDIILLTYPTCPFRTAVSIDGALKLFMKSGARSLQSLTAVHYRPYGLMFNAGGNRFLCMQDQGGCYQRQNTPPLYKANGAIFIFRVSELDKLNNQMFNDDTMGYELDEVEGLDIDTPLDFLLAKSLERERNERIADQLPGKGVREAEPDSTGSGVHFEYSETGRP